MIQSESEGLRTKGAHGLNLSPRAREDAISQLKLVRWEKSGEFLLSLPFVFVQALNRFYGAHSHWGGQSTLPSPLIQMVILSRNTLTDTSRNNV